MAYDPIGGYTVLFGGESMGSRTASAHPLADTWTFRAGTWTNVTGTAGTAPTARAGAAMTFDAADGYILLAGGFDASNNYLADIWKFSSGRWTELSASGLPTSLQDVCGTQAAFDSADNFTMFLGASCNSGPTGGVAMAYRGGAWWNPDFNQTTGPRSPVPGYEGGILVNDPQLKGLLFFGGTTIYGNGARQESVVYSAGNWTDQTANFTAAPPGQDVPGGDFDQSYGGVLVYGGFQPGAFPSPPRATWVLKNTTWLNLSAGTSPPSVSGSSGGQLVWDGADNVSLWFGGFLNYTWSWGTAFPLSGLSILVAPSIPGVGESVTFSSTHVGGRPPLTYDWAFGDGSSSTSDRPSHSYAAPGSYQVNLSLTDSTSASVRATLSLDVGMGSTSAIVARPNPTDAGVPVVFQPQIAAGSGPLSYSWNFGDGAGANGSVVVHSYTSPGSYIAAVVATADGGGTINSTVTVTVNPNPVQPVVTVDPEVPELGQTVNFSVYETGGTAPYTYSWAFGDGGLGGNLSTISHIFTTNGPFVTEVNVTDAVGQYAVGRVNMSIRLQALVGSSSTSGLAPLLITFVGQGQGGAPPYRFLWNFGDGNTSTEQNPNHTYSADGRFSVILTVTDAKNNQSSTSLVIQVGPVSGATNPSSLWFVPYVIVGIFILGVAGSWAALVFRRRSRRREGERWIEELTQGDATNGRGPGP